MGLSKKPVTGMKDILPEEMKIRNYVQNVIKDTYKAFGFTQIETPCVENISNLTNKQGGENEKLIFKILKRGEKLNLETAKEDSDVVDNGLRYDLTVPLVRYYSNNANNLPSPFKALQMGNVWRADRPQRGRYRQFMQCDIDILGDPSNLAEIELILATTTTLGKLGFKNFQIRINERRILKAMAAYSGFPEDSYDSVFIILDKMDKIGLDGVKEELIKYEFAPESVKKYTELFEYPKISAGTHMQIEFNPKVANFFWGKDNFIPQVDKLNQIIKENVFQNQNDNGDGYTICPIRFSIGAIYFEKELLEKASYFPVKKGSCMGLDEVFLCNLATTESKVMIISENQVVGHLSFGKQNEPMKEYFLNNKDIFEIK